MTVLVTGAAGFIGSHAAAALLRRGSDVLGLDNFDPYYSPARKRLNIEDVAREARRPGQFELVEGDIRDRALLGRLFESRPIRAVVHLAAMAGLVRSWADFDLYQSCNLTATHRLLDAVGHRSVRRFVLASTSSVYGRHASGDESLPTRPISPYGVTKLAAENLCRAHADECGLPLVVLRYFSVYGPRQRPDMGYHRFIAAMLEGRPLTVGRSPWRFAETPIVVERGPPSLGQHTREVLAELTAGESLAVD